MTMPRIFPRWAWGARSPRCVEYRNLSDIRTFFVHYSDTHESIPSPAHFSDVLVVQAIQRYHMDTRGYCDIAYACMIGGNGDIYLGRPNNVVQASTYGHNRDEWSSCFLSDGPITDQQWNSFEVMLYLCAVNFPAMSHRPLPHSAVYPTACPGDDVRARLERQFP
jgi:hypothetical protein